MSRIVIQLSGGLVADQFLIGTGTPTEVIIIDEDVDQADEDEITTVKINKKQTYRALVHAETLNHLPLNSDVARMLRTFDENRS
jgi:hypothetical protein